MNDGGRRGFGETTVSGVAILALICTCGLGCTQRGRPAQSVDPAVADCAQSGGAGDGMRLESIGVVRSPYTDEAPFQPLVDDQGDLSRLLARNKPGSEVEVRYVRGEDAGERTATVVLGMRPAEE